ncbi:MULTISPECIES: 3-deoxy-D-manno-octulosonic acid kinase [Rhodanobacter]|uniref:3-deoxy-D-manno-octulosonic acid kinase n=1 Tax=Rhodanobacter TaxID=75309 RepID=UPI0003FFE129|nr:MULTISPECIES: 3-deoxy-D-manno-octulosonic acid kinase [Rhodanobacter]KZC21589.1 3-deoxy-D-manno-octulosonic acid kinase [Rhodanobacter denitrificans]UJJ52459.1 3-deoxy-D-manno-octulosonic acid kinase [Rhodanobacter denitrificans]UJM95212.1 3-deoxy-D-manno-octulosonic acid kinase [Rhodanobacter denitrificans]UJM98743.1 3-deoxy-D-manno-octulosonic acid kinase [Rhodanobacter denitrificans]UJN21842.1 3-deoxy-D-manno-octulosonic acid kinase [Rhodanobacter denitrificans]
MMMQERTHTDAEGAILFDAEVSPQVGHDWFAPDYWRQRGALRTQAGGRGGVAIVAAPVGECVLRHYRRGGRVAALMGDRYFWTGADRTRPFVEFRVLAEIARLELPGPPVVAARYRRHGLFYSADLITRRIAGAQTLAECLAAGRLDGELAEEVGALVARFHRAGVWHADLNAHNVLVAPGALYLIDFDRGRMRIPAAGWQRANLRRLRRSLLKLGAAADGETAFEKNIWQPLLYRYERTLTP